MKKLDIEIIAKFWLVVIITTGMGLFFGAFTAELVSHHELHLYCMALGSAMGLGGTAISAFWAMWQG